MSPRALRSMGVALLLVVTGGIAWAQGVEGGCTATINGRPPASLTADNAIEVENDQVVSIIGTVPPSVANQEDVESTTEITLFAGVLNGVPLETVEGTGPEWGGDAEVPDAIFDYAPGIYLVGGEASGTGGWSCEGSGYIEITGGPWTAALAVGAIFSLAGLFLLKAARGPIRTASDKRVRRARPRARASGARATSRTPWTITWRPTRPPMRGRAQSPRAIVAPSMPAKRRGPASCRIPWPNNRMRLRTNRRKGHAGPGTERRKAAAAAVRFRTSYPTTVGPEHSTLSASSRGQCPSRCS